MDSWIASATKYLRHPRRRRGCADRADGKELLFQIRLSTFYHTRVSLLPHSGGC